MDQISPRKSAWRASLSEMIRTSVASTTFAVLLLISWTLGAAAAQVGSVTAVANQAQIDATAAVVGASIHMDDRLRTGPNGRLRVTFSDGSVLTLGENASVVVDRFVYNPEKSKGEVLLSASQGAIRFAGGKLKEMTDRKITVNTPSAALAVRGTEFWAGPIDGKYGVLLLKGHVGVSNRRGAVALSTPGTGTDLPLRHKKAVVR